MFTFVGKTIIKVLAPIFIAVEKRLLEWAWCHMKDLFQKHSANGNDNMVFYVILLIHMIYTSTRCNFPPKIDMDLLTKWRKIHKCCWGRGFNPLGPKSNWSHSEFDLTMLTFYVNILYFMWVWFDLVLHQIGIIMLSCCIIWSFIQ